MITVLMSIAGGLLGCALGAVIFFPDVLLDIYRNWKSK